MPNFPNEKIAAVQQRLLDGMKTYKEIAGDACGYTQKDINRCAAILDTYLGTVAEVCKPSQNDIRDAVKKAVQDLNALNKKCGGNLIETDQREDLCQIILVTAVNAGLDTHDDITENWREW